jgi:hypothetical protein
MSIVIVIGGFLWALRSATVKGASLAGLVIGIALATLLVLERDSGDPPLLVIYPVFLAQSLFSGLFIPFEASPLEYS